MPNSTASQSASRVWPVSRGRQISMSSRAAEATRRNTVPPGPTSSKIDFASAAPNCTDATAAITSRVGGTRSAGCIAGDNPDMRPSAAAPLVILLLLVAACGSVHDPRAQSRPNVVVLMTDDQTLASLRVMSGVRSQLADAGT